MMSDDQPSAAKRVRMSDDDLKSMSKEQLEKEIRRLDSYIECMEKEQRQSENDCEDLRVRLANARRKEITIVSRLTNKEQEIQEYSSNIQKMKQETSPYSSSGQLRVMHLDPAVNLVFLAMQKEIDSLKEKLEQSQNELSSWKFTPDSQTGKKLMSKCRMLHQENEELGKMMSSGRISKLESQVALEKSLIQRMKKTQSELDEFLDEIDEDVEGMQGVVYQLQQQLKDTKSQLDSALERLHQLEPPLDTDMTDVNDERTERTLDDQAAPPTDVSPLSGLPSVVTNHVTERIDLSHAQTAIKVEVDAEPMEVERTTAEPIANVPETLIHTSSADEKSSTPTDQTATIMQQQNRKVIKTEVNHDWRTSSLTTPSQPPAAGDAKSKRSSVLSSGATRSSSRNIVTRPPRTTSLDALDG